MMRYVDAMLTAEAKIDNVARWCRENGVNRRTFYRHRARIEAEGRWVQRSRRPKHSPNASPELVVGEVLRLRRDLAPDNGADPIRDRLLVLAAEQGWSGQGLTVPSRATINRILDRHGLLVKNPKKRPRASWRRFSYARPRDCYQIDATEVRLANGEKVVVFDVLDDCTRLLVACHAALAETGDAAITAITKAKDAFGAPAIVLCDNGTAFTTRWIGGPTTKKPAPGKFTRTVTAWNTRLIHSSPYHPQTCGKVERHHQTLKRWLAHQTTRPQTLAQLQTQLTTYQAYYNIERTHTALRRQTPRQAWDNAESHGGPNNMPRQTDANLHENLKVARNGIVDLGTNIRINLGTKHAEQTINIVIDHNRATAYALDGNPIGYIHIDHNKHYQGKLTPAA